MEDVNVICLGQGIAAPNLYDCPRILELAMIALIELKYPNTIPQTQITRVYQVGVEASYMMIPIRTVMGCITCLLQK
jgi:hypothetical protein